MLTETIWVKHQFTETEIMDLAQKMARAEANIKEKEDNLKSVSTSIKAEIAGQEAVLHSCAEKLRGGYEMRPREAEVKYENGMARYIDTETGEVLEERTMTQDEQLKLNGRRIDAEVIIRESSAEED